MGDPGKPKIKGRTQSDLLPPSIRIGQRAFSRAEVLVTEKFSIAGESA